MSIFSGEIVETGRAATTPRASASGLAEEIAAGWEAGRRINRINNHEILSQELMAERIAGIEAATGTRLANPYRDQFEEVDANALRRSYAARGLRAGEAGPEIIARKVAAFEARVDALAASMPDANVETRAAFEERLRRRAGELESRLEGTGLGGFIGQAGAEFTDPINLATAPIGFGSKTVLGAALREAGVNIGIEAALQPALQSSRREVGLSYGAREAAVNIAAAGVFGAVFGGGVKLGEKAFGLMTRREAIAAVDKLPESAKTDAVMAARNDLERVLAIDEAAGLDRRPDPEIAADHRAALRAAEEAVDAGRAPAVEAPLVGETAPARALPADYGDFDPDAVIVDAKRFQFKSGGDAAGVTGALKGVEKFDPIKAGELLFWQAEDGKVFVADGHQRTGLARGLKARGDANARLRGPILKESDGITAEDARAIAAAKNIAQGTGTAIDAAKVLKVKPELLDGTLSRRTALMRDAEGLIRLADDAFGMVINEVVPAQYGAIVGRLVDDAVEQLSVMGVVARQSPANATEAEALVREALAAGFRRETQEGLFGAEIDAENLLGVRAAILGGAVSQLRRDKRIFATLSDEADTIEAAGNRLAKEENEELARNATEISDIVLRTAHVSGPVADALRRAAEHVAGGGQKAAAIRQFIGELRELGPAALRGLDGSRGGARAAGSAGEIAGQGGPVPAARSDLGDALADFDDPEAGAQFQRDELTADLFGEGNNQVGTKTSSRPSNDNYARPPKTKFSTASTTDIAAALDEGEFVNATEFEFEIGLSARELRRIWTLSDNEKVKNLELAMSNLAKKNIFVQALPDDFRVSRMENGNWTPAGDIADEAFDRLAANQFNRTMGRTLSVDEFNKKYASIYDHAQRESAAQDIAVTDLLDDDAVYLTGEALDDKGLVAASTQTRKQLEEEFKADDDMIARLEGCVRK